MDPGTDSGTASKRYGRPELGDAVDPAERGHPFSTAAAGVPTAPGRCVDASAMLPSTSFAPGLQPVLDERSMVNFVTFAEHTVAAHHVHEEECIVIVLDGEFESEVDGALAACEARSTICCQAAGVSVMSARSAKSARMSVRRVW